MSQAVVEKKKTGRRSPEKKKHGAGLEPVVLREIEQSRLHALNAFYRRRRPVKLTIAGQSFAVAADWPDEADAASLASVMFSIDGARGELNLPLSLIEEWIARIDPEADLAQLAPEHVALLLECALSEDLNRLEAQFGWAVIVKSVGTGPADLAGGSFNFRLVRGETIANCTLSVEDRWAVRFGQVLDTAQRGTPPLRLEVPATVNVWRGVTTISLADLRSLGPGDVIVSEEMNYAQDTAIAIFADRLVAPVQAAADGWLLTAGLRPVAATKWEWTMNHSKQPPAARVDDSDLEDLPLTVAFEVGRVTMSLKEISQLTPGAVVQIADVSDQAVDLLANGKRIGRGELVRIGDGVGVQVTRIFGDA